MLQQFSLQDIRALQIFLTVADCKGITAAQTVLDLAQSGISLHIKHIEKKLGFTLCNRGRSGFSLTPEGIKVYAACQHLSDALNTFNDEILKIQEEKNTLSGTLNIAIVDNLPDSIQNIIPLCIKEIYETHPNIVLNLEINTPTEIESKILSNQTDIGIGYFGKHLKEIVYKPIAKEVQKVYFSPTHTLATECLSLEQITTQVPWVQRGYVMEKDLVPIKPTILTATTYHMEATLLFIKAGTHIGYLPENYANIYAQRNLIVPLESPQLDYSVPHSLMTKNTNSPLVKLFSQIMTKLLAAANGL